ncbi:MAG: rhomboid family intramembrane serine protease [Pseudomonadota bacterium]
MEVQPRPTSPVHPVLWLIVGTMLLIHLLPMVAEMGLAGPKFSGLALQYRYGFYTGYGAESWTELPVLFWTSFITHAFLHGSWLHFGMNAAVFLALGHRIEQVAGLGAVLIVFFVSAIAGALAFSLITEGPAVLVGASGGIFGQLGIVVAWRARLLQAEGRSRAPIWRLIGGLAAINALMAVGLSGMGDGANPLGGQLGWEAHLGGFVAGWLLALVIWPRGWRR